MKIILAPKTGFCFGVRRAFNMSLQALNNKPRPCQVLGPLVHNEYVVAELKNKGIRLVNSLNKLKAGTVIISAHGEDPKIIEKIGKIGLEMVDTTCPLVKKVQNLAKILRNKGCQVIIIGDRHHKEVKSIQATIGGIGIIIESGKDPIKLKAKKKLLAVIAQTTQNPESVKKIIRKLKNKFKKVKFYNTLCPTVQNYQKEVKKLASKVDLLLIIGSKTSANTKRLVEIVRASRKSVYHIENAGQLEKRWFSNAKKVGVATGTSVPDWSTDEIIKKLKSYAS